MIRANVVNLRRVRCERGYDQLDVCQAAGVNRSTYSLIETGKAGLRPKTAKRICDFLQQPFDELFVYIDERKEA